MALWSKTLSLCFCIQCLNICLYMDWNKPVEPCSAFHKLQNWERSNSEGHHSGSLGVFWYYLPSRRWNQPLLQKLLRKEMCRHQEIEVDPQMRQGGPIQNSIPASISIQQKGIRRLQFKTIVPEVIEIEYMVSKCQMNWSKIYLHLPCN